MSTKVSRRSVIKLLGAAGVALAAAPLIGKVAALPQRPGLQKAQEPASIIPSHQSSSETLVLVVRGNEILGYRGLNKIPVSDASLAGMLHGRFKGVSN